MSDNTAQNPYAIPSSELQENVTSDQAPSIEQALSRGYDYSITQLIGEAWQLISGTKGIIFAGFVVFYLVMFIASFIIGLVFGIFGAMSDNMALALVVQFATSIFATAVAYPFLAGVSMIGIRRAAGQPFSFNDIFSYFGRTVPLLITAILMMVLIYIGFFLLILPGIYLSVAYMLAMQLVVERNLSPWQALEASRKALSQHWFKAFGLFLLLGLIVAVSIIPLGIGLVWSVPLFVVATGVLYRTIFGVLPAAR